MVSNLTTSVQPWTKQIKLPETLRPLLIQMLAKYSVLANPVWVKEYRQELRLLHEILEVRND